MHDNIYVEGLEEGQVLADEIWTKIDQEIALHSEDELKKDSSFAVLVIICSSSSKNESRI